mmetsp:Transcript_11122/g.12737  ORF Transcript_11122/g.12737 Transcript_11122/m.12737 type:complete len:386 (+) Transcript_11122:118-1275(+)
MWSDSRVSSNQEKGYSIRCYGILFILVVVIPYLLFRGKVDTIPESLQELENEPENFDVDNLDDSYGAERDIYHIVLMYEHLKAASLCTPETVIRSLFKGATEGHTKPAEVWVWLSHLDQQEEIFQGLEEYIDENKPLRDVKLRKLYLDFDDMMAGTPFEEFYKDKTPKQLGKYGDQNKGNGLRLVILQKYGGFYMDADMLVINDPTILHDGVAQQSKGVYNNAAFKFSQPNHPILNILIDDFIENYNGNKWGQQGPLLFSRVLKRKIPCTIRRDNKELECKGIELDEPVKKWQTRQIYPLAWYSGYSMGKSYKFMVSKHKLNLNDPRETIMIHTWHKHSKLAEARLCKKSEDAYRNSFIGILKSKHCPITTDVVFKNKDDLDCKF